MFFLRNLLLLINNSVLLKRDLAICRGSFILFTTSLLVMGFTLEYKEVSLLIYIFSCYNIDVASLKVSLPYSEFRTLIIEIKQLEVHIFNIYINSILLNEHLFDFFILGSIFSCMVIILVIRNLGYIKNMVDKFGHHVFFLLSYIILITTAILFKYSEDIFILLNFIPIVFIFYTFSFKYIENKFNKYLIVRILILTVFTVLGSIYAIPVYFLDQAIHEDIYNIYRSILAMIPLFYLFTITVIILFMVKSKEKFKELFINLCFTLMFYTLFSNIGLVIFILKCPLRNIDLIDYVCIKPFENKKFKPSDYNIFIRSFASFASFATKIWFLGNNKYNCYLEFFKNTNKVAIDIANDMFNKVAKNLHNIYSQEKMTMTLWQEFKGTFISFYKKLTSPIDYKKPRPFIIRPPMPRKIIMDYNINKPKITWSDLKIEINIDLWNYIKSFSIVTKSPNFELIEFYDIRNNILYRGWNNFKDNSVIMVKRDYKKNIESAVSYTLRYNEEYAEKQDYNVIVPSKGINSPEPIYKVKPYKAPLGKNPLPKGNEDFYFGYEWIYNPNASIPHNINVNWTAFPLRNIQPNLYPAAPSSAGQPILEAQLSQPDEQVTQEVPITEGQVVNQGLPMNQGQPIPLDLYEQLYGEELNESLEWNPVDINEWVPGGLHTWEPEELPEGEPEEQLVAQQLPVELPQELPLPLTVDQQLAEEVPVGQPVYQGLPVVQELSVEQEVDVPQNLQVVQAQAQAQSQAIYTSNFRIMDKFITKWSKNMKTAEILEKFIFNPNNIKTIGYYLDYFDSENKYVLACGLNSGLSPVSYSEAKHHPYSTVDKTYLTLFEKVKVDNIDVSANEYIEYIKGHPSLWKNDTYILIGFNVFKLVVDDVYPLNIPNDFICVVKGKGRVIYDPRDIRHAGKVLYFKDVDNSYHITTSRMKSRIITSSNNPVVNLEDIRIVITSQQGIYKELDINKNEFFDVLNQYRYLNRNDFTKYGNVFPTREYNLNTIIPSEMEKTGQIYIEANCIICRIHVKLYNRLYSGKVNGMEDNLFKMDYDDPSLIFTREEKQTIIDALKIGNFVLIIVDNSYYLSGTCLYDSVPKARSVPLGSLLWIKDGKYQSVSNTEITINTIKEKLNNVHIPWRVFHLNN